MFNNVYNQFDGPHNIYTTPPPPPQHIQNRRGEKEGGGGGGEENGCWTCCLSPKRSSRQSLFCLCWLIGAGLQSVLWGRKTSQSSSVGTVLVFVSKYRVTSEQTLYSNPQTLSCATPFVYTVHVRSVLRLTVSKSSSRFVFANC